MLADLTLFDIPLFPARASALAERVDALLLCLVLITGTVAFLVAALLLFFAIRYRRRGDGDSTPRILGWLRLEWFWTLAPIPIFILFYIWGANIYMTNASPPADALDVYVVGKQWMWKIQHPGGQREINTLHLPVGRKVRLTLISEDVIHDFYVPAFRTKMDVLPGRYTRLWYEPTQTGRFRLFCSQYCGTDHAGMVGEVIVMEPREYETWLSQNAEGSMALEGRKQFLKFQCVTCHSADAEARAPALEGLFGRTVTLNSGRTVRADESYLRESILRPRDKIVQGFEPIMPTFEGQVTAEELNELVEYLKSLTPGATPVRTEAFPPPVGAPTEPK
jgi:cytochrome c oxidase subunit 2